MGGEQQFNNRVIIIRRGQHVSGGSEVPKFSDKNPGARTSQREGERMSENAREHESKRKREREGGRKKYGEREGGRDGEYQREHVCVHSCVCDFMSTSVRVQSTCDLPYG